ncbi:MAG: YfiR family protein [Candidatus Latescibacterota bacterium]
MPTDCTPEGGGDPAPESPDRGRLRRAGRRAPRLRLGGGLALCLGALSLASPASPQEMPVPVSVQYPLFVKALLFDRQFRPRSRDAVVLGIAYQRSFRASLTAMEALVQAMADTPDQRVAGLPLRHVLVDLGGHQHLDGIALPLPQLDLLYVAPLRAFDLPDLTQASARAGVLTLTGVPNYCRSGVVLGIGSRGGKPTLVVNLPAARAAGADFSARLLSLATVIP